ncbi:polysaccharide deacetylase family protein [Yinghuangia soli]|uniref:Polysaccharide deacetylase family protein n=1 Tax=Yinghuangia soli TaxID=2908204 RepID=A0AA41U305_9ACTN|nr:polysaccharide deacetylase family protein [Yinghuangia soli]MCF2527609.1 polysaccharide deacetylase family protein [Yinghuangia soli]
MIPTNRERSRRRIAAACVLAAATAAACASPDDSPGLQRKAKAPASAAADGPDVAPKPVPGAADPKAKAAAEAQAAEAARSLQAAQAVKAAEAAAARQEELRVARAAAAQRWGLPAMPLFAPAPPAAKPELAANGQHVVTKPGLPPIVRRVPTTDKVVFLTIDDGLEKDPEFSRMIRELGIPVSAFVTDYLARPNYGYFRDLHTQGVAVHNHTINHKDLRKLSDEGQHREICNQQENLLKEIGVRPHLFRPPFGEYTDATLRAAASCGVTAVPLWNQEAFADRMEYRYGDRKFHPGDIILTHFRGPETWKGSMTDMLRLTLREVTAQGFALARLEDYL